MTQTITDRVGFERARELVMRYGWNTNCFQIINPGIEYWFGSDGESVVGYVTSGKVRVVAGAPVCAHQQLPAVASAFEADARRSDASVWLESRYRSSDGHAKVLLGAQPVWHPSNWGHVIATRSSLRAQSFSILVQGLGKAIAAETRNFRS